MDDLDTYNKDRAIPCCTCIYKLSKICSKFHQDISEKEYQKCLKDCIDLKGSGSINEISDHVLSFKGEAGKIQKIVKCNLYFIANN